MKKITISALLAVIAIAMVTPLAFAGEGETLSEICDRKTTNEKSGFPDAACEYLDEVKNKLFLLEDSAVENRNDIDANTDEFDTVYAVISGVRGEASDALTIAGDNQDRIDAQDRTIILLDDRLTTVEGLTIAPKILETIQFGFTIAEGEMHSGEAQCTQGQVLNYDLNFLTDQPRIMTHLEIKSDSVGLGFMGIGQQGPSAVRVIVDCGIYELVK